MTPRAAFCTGILCCSVAACGTEPDDPQGTYRLEIMLRSELRPVALPSTVHWPRTADLVLRFDDAGNAQVELLGFRADVFKQEVVVDGATRFSPPQTDGSLFLELDSQFLVQVDDLTACPQNGTGRNGRSFELFFLNGQAHGSTSDVVFCDVPPPDLVFQGFIFDVTGERVSR